MGIIPAKCTHCGASITIDVSKDVGTCQYCGMSFIIEKTVNNYTINNINITPQNNVSYNTQNTPPKRMHTVDKPDMNSKDCEIFKNLDSSIEYYEQMGINVPDTNKTQGANADDTIAMGEPAKQCRTNVTQQSQKNFSQQPVQGQPNYHPAQSNVYGQPTQHNGMPPVHKRPSHKKQGKILGFRTDTTWKKVISIIYLVCASFWLFPMLIASLISGELLVFILWLMCVALTLSPYICLSNFKLRDHLPLFNKHNFIHSAIGLICVDALIIIFGFMAGVIVSIPSESTCTHNWETVSEVHSTCVEVGYINKKCTLCGKEETEALKEEIKHIFNAKKITPTDSYRICSICHDAVNEEENTNSNGEYLLGLVLDNHNHYAFAVEIDNYNGDVFEAGTYRFYPEDVVLGTKKVPIVWDIYVSDKVYDDISQLHDDNPDFVDAVGGLDKCETTITLKQGQYVYIKYYKPANEPTGHLEIVKTNDK